MCLAIPGKIIEIKDNIAIVDYEILQKKAQILEDKYKIGDYVVVQAGIILQKVPEKEALETIKLFKNAT